VTPPKRSAVRVTIESRDFDAVRATRPGRGRAPRGLVLSLPPGRSMCSLTRAPRLPGHAVTQSVATWLPFRASATGLGAGGPPENASEYL
jgi:hypothetical protein